jgi:ATP-dependent RNA helicase RhlE
LRTQSNSSSPRSNNHKHNPSTGGHSGHGGHTGGPRRLRLDDLIESKPKHTASASTASAPAKAASHSKPEYTPRKAGPAHVSQSDHAPRAPRADRDSRDTRDTRDNRDNRDTRGGQRDNRDTRDQHSHGGPRRGHTGQRDQRSGGPEFVSHSHQPNSGVYAPRGASHPPEIDHTPANIPTAKVVLGSEAVTVTFADLNLAEPLMEALREENYVTPTPIQALTIPTTMSGRDILGCAQTGTGKTAAFALPILHRLVTSKPDTTQRGRPKARVLVLSPTRELATQIAESFKAYGRHTGVTGTVIFGGVGQGNQVRALQRGVDVIVATPGRLLDLMEQRHVDLSGIEVLVLDEADRMLDMGFIKPIREIAAAITTPGRQTLLFSATMPREIMHLADSLLKTPVKVAVTPVASAAPKIEQTLYMVSRMQKLNLLLHILNEQKVTRTVVFSKTKHGSDKLCKKLVQSGVSAVAIHGNKAQNQRDRALDAFKAGRVRVLVATDVAARGLDVDAITHVFNYDLPMEPEGYVHRIGRTGRAGASGIAISFCDHDERDLLRQIERLLAKKIPLSQIPEGLPKHEPRFENTDDSSDDSYGGSSNSYGSRGGQRSYGPASRSSHAPRAHTPRVSGHGGYGHAHPDAPRPAQDSISKPVAKRYFRAGKGVGRAR